MVLPVLTRLHCWQRTPPPPPLPPPSSTPRTCRNCHCRPRHWTLVYHPWLCKMLSKLAETSQDASTLWGTLPPPFLHHSHPDLGVHACPCFCSFRFDQMLASLPSHIWHLQLLSPSSGQTPPPPPPPPFPPSGLYVLPGTNLSFIHAAAPFVMPASTLMTCSLGTA